MFNSKDKEKFKIDCISKARGVLESGEDYEFKDYYDSKSPRIALDNIEACVGWYLEHSHEISLTNRINSIVSAKNDTEMLILSKNLKEWFIQSMAEEIASLEWLSQ